MRIKEAFKKICKSRNVTFIGLAAIVGTTSASVSKMTHKGNPTVDALNKYLNPIGYKVALVPDGTVLPPDCYIIEGNAGRNEAE